MLSIVTEVKLPSMSLEQLFSEITKIKLKETRLCTENALEVVIAKNDLGALTVALESYFGPALKPEGAVPSREAANLAEPYGGIRRDQTLYFHKNESTADVALLWPWGSGGALTVKIFRE